MRESFPTQDGPEDIIMSCESCGNYLYLRGPSDPVIICPICGGLNQGKLKKGDMVKGQIVIKSQKMSMNRDSLTTGRISLPGLPTEVQEALLWLQKHHWRFGFTIEEENLEE